MDTDPLPDLCGIILNTAVNAGQAIEFHAPPSWGAWAVIVAIACCCLLLSAFFSGSEIAFFALTPAQIDDMEDDEEEHPANRKILRLLSDTDRLLATILVGNNLVNITMVVLLSFAINQTMTIHSGVVSFLLQSVFLTFLLLLFGEIFPKLLANRGGDSWRQMAVAPMLWCEKLFMPVSSMLVKSTSVVNKVVSKRESTVSTDELSQALEISDVKAGKDKEMLKGILSFGSKEVSDIMISRVDVTAIEYHAGWSEVIDTILDSGYSRIPVYDTNQDTIRGVLYSKDLLPYIGKKDDTFVWQNLVRDAYFVPESRMIDDLLEDFRRKKIHIAIVVDEYGGVQGIVTLEDIIEEIVGEIDDEYDEDHSLYHRISENTYVFDGKIPLTDFCRICGVDEKELGDIGEAETLAGLLLAIKGDFPAKKETFVIGRYRFLVLDMQKHRITSVRVNVMDHPISK